MLDVLLLASGPFFGWLIYMGFLEPLLCPDECRWNHLLSGMDSVRRLRPQQCQALEDLEIFHWQWDELSPCISIEREAECLSEST